MNAHGEPPQGRLVSILRKPMTWIALALLVLISAATAAVALELYASTSEPMEMNSR
ncbi:MAG: hypothetical protein K0M70_02760 [Arenimonas sp.]|uniref:hypothetical protein n=1 Tax=Arenimonas sp. TaxID=1872635 RepID=UPI0025C07AE0|nr:hypothetical protein [Arenimonas sp.]MBW8366762.1 hypothetical protein [Arenimonas sp.]